MLLDGLVYKQSQLKPSNSNSRPRHCKLMQSVKCGRGSGLQLCRPPGRGVAVKSHSSLLLKRRLEAIFASLGTLLLLPNLQTYKVDCISGC